MLKEIIRKMLILCACFVVSVLLLAHERSAGYLSVGQMQKALIVLIFVSVALFWLTIIRVASRHKAADES
jgi:hypothetical protein